jgi:hypothetical protein
MTEGEHKKKMSYALWSMTRRSKHHHRIVTSAQYNIVRNAFVSAQKSKKLSKETKAKISASRKGKSHPNSEKNVHKMKQPVGVWKVTHPCGKVEEVVNLAQFCRDNNVSKSNLSGGSSKGFKAERIGTVLKIR